MTSEANVMLRMATEEGRDQQSRNLLAYYAVLKGLDQEIVGAGVDGAWEQGGRGVAEVMKKVLKLGESLEDACTTTLAVARVFGMEIGETEMGRRVTVTRCPLCEMGKESGRDRGKCLGPCLVFINSVAKAFDDRFSVKRTMALPQGDSVCEALWVTECCDGQGRRP